MKKALFSAGLATVFILCAQPAEAGTQIYVNLGYPAVQVDLYGEETCGDEVWVEGCYRFERPRYVWVPGHWVPCRALYGRTPAYHRYYHRPPRDYRSHSPRDFHGYHDGWGRDDSGDRGHDSYRHRPNPSRGRDSHRGHEEYRTNGNWMDNIHRKVLTRQVRDRSTP